MWGIQQARSWEEDENTDIAEGYLVGRRENYRGATGKLISAQPQWFRHRAQLLWTLEGARVGTGAWHFFHCGCLLDWTGLDWAGLGSVQLRGSLEQNTTKGTWEANFKEVWDDAWDKQLLSMCSTHQSPRYVWDLSKKGESAASASVDPHIPIAGVAEWPTSLDHILGFRGSLPHDWRACVPTRKWTCYTHVQLLQRGTATEIPMLNLGCRCEHILHSRFSHWSLPLSPIFPAGISCGGWICTKSASGDHTYNRHSY